MQMVVFGAGGVGGYLAAKLGKAMHTGAEGISDDTPGGLTGLSIVARGKHLAAIRARGLSYTSPDGTESVVHPTLATDNPADLPVPDLVLLCVKGYDLTTAVASLTPRLHAQTQVLPLLNGADIDERIRSASPGTIVFPGCIYVSAFIEEPGRVRHTGGAGNIVMGTCPDAPGLRPDWFLRLCGRAGIPVDWQSEPATAIWTKFLFIAPFSLVTAASGLSLGAVLASDVLAADVRAIMVEVAEIARRKGIRLADNAVDVTMDKAAGFPPDTRTSLQRDIAAGSARDERDVFAGTIARLGTELDVPTPVTHRYLLMLP